MSLEASLEARLEARLEAGFLRASRYSAALVHDASTASTDPVRPQQTQYGPNSPCTDLLARVQTY